MVSRKTEEEKKKEAMKVRGARRVFVVLPYHPALEFGLGRRFVELVKVWTVDLSMVGLPEIALVTSWASCGATVRSVVNKGNFRGS